MNHECQGVPKVLHLYQSRHAPLMSRASQITYPVLTDEPIKAHREPGMSSFRADVSGEVRCSYVKHVGNSRNTHQPTYSAHVFSYSYHGKFQF